MASLAIRKAYKDSTLLVSGASGFLGQVLLEKTLRTLDPRKMYLLIRKKKNLSADQRLQKILSGVLFDRVRSSAAVQRLVPIEVDMNRDDMGLDGETRRRLEQEVGIVFNLAASVSFNEPLDVSLRENTLNTVKFFNLVRSMENLKAAVHVSTMYSNCDRDTIGEKIYSDVGFGGVDCILDLLTKLDGPELEALTPVILKGHNSTYTFAKKCTEAKLQQDFVDLPVGVYRPPIISSTHRSPIPSWTNNLFGVGGYVTPLILGLYSPYLVDGTVSPMIAPVDYCANSLLLSAVDISNNSTSRRDGLPVYNFADNNVPNYDNMYHSLLDGMQLTKRLAYRHIMNVRTTNQKLYEFGVQLMQFQASLMDQVRVFRGQKPVLRKLVENMISFAAKSHVATLKNWNIQNANVTRVQQSLDAEESKLFHCDLRTIDWHEHFKNFSPGIKKYVFSGKVA